jgi:hypothetical protein
VARDAGLDAGVVETLTPHKLRHACARTMLHAGWDIAAVQSVLDHAPIQTFTSRTVTACAGASTAWRSGRPTPRWGAWIHVLGTWRPTVRYPRRSECLCSVPFSCRSSSRSSVPSVSAVAACFRSINGPTWSSAISGR